MPNLYMGRGGIDGMFNSAAPISRPYPSYPSPMPGDGSPIPNPYPNPAPAQNGTPPGTPPTYSGLPAETTVSTTPTSFLPAQTIRPTGPTKGYDPAYLQNLATSIGALFARPSGNLNFNPLGNLSEISPSSGMGGNAPEPGAPLTWLQQALNGLGFTWPPLTPPATPTAATNGNRAENVFNPRGPMPRYLS